MENQMKLLDMLLAFQQLLAPEGTSHSGSNSAMNTHILENEELLVQSLSLEKEAHKDTNYMALRRIKEAMLYLDKEHQKPLKLLLHYIEAKMIVNKTKDDRSLVSLMTALHPHLEDDKKKVVGAMMLMLDMTTNK